MRIIQADLKYTNPLIPLDPNKVDTIFIHHIAHDNATAEDIHKWHLNNGWNGAGYAEYIRKDGTVYILRGNNIGAQCANYNSKSYGIACEGNFDDVKRLIDKMPEVQMESLISRIKNAQSIYKKAQRVLPHSAFIKSSCPGRYFPMSELYDRLSKDAKITNVDEALKVLADKGIINSPTYWKNVLAMVKYFDTFVLNVANYVNEH